MSHIDNLEKSIPERGNIKCKGPKVEAYLAVSGKTKETNVVSAK